MVDSLTYKPWALATLSVSNMRALPDDTSELVSQALMGTPLKVQDQNGKWYQVQTPEGYTGWMDTGGLHLCTAKELDSWKKSGRYFFNHLSGYAYDTPSLKGNIVTDLVLGDIFEAEPVEKEFLKIRIPDGRSGYVQIADCISFEVWSSLEPSVQPVLSFARQMMGSPYLWGGASSKGSDCSGFVKLVYYSQGIILARDASQQARYGEPVDISKIGSLLPGDLLFFGSSPPRVGHVGIYLGNGDFINSSGRVHISSIIPGDPKHVPARILIAAQRIMNSPDTEGITCVKSHPWYVSYN